MLAPLPGVDPFWVLMQCCMSFAFHRNVEQGLSNDGQRNLMNSQGFFQTQTESFKAVIWASCSPLPTGAEVMRDQREKEARRNERRDSEEMQHCYSF